MKDSKNLVIGMLCAVICIMAVAYAAFSTTLTINGTTSIESSWCVQIKDAAISCTSTPVSGGAKESVTASAVRTSATLATVTMKFSQPGDTATCTIVFENCGSLDAKLNKLTVTGNDESGPIRFTVTGLTEGSTKLEKTTGTANVVVTGTYDTSVTSQPEGGTTTKTLSVKADFGQDLGA